MLRGEKVVLRALERDDLRRQWAFNNDLETELRDEWEETHLA